VNVQVAPGRMTTIQFQSDEIMTAVIIADSSLMVYTASAELGSPQAKSLFLS
jgi:type IV secretory pathway VirB9-like protein